ncbi:hypothetical protein BS47DRAFT_592868 [Hydnum rufescens UP504]|uniref:BRCT domain-containing protein n=1 Tax=Hydnum rufescens UP504 TaxID=1448309 RepID=A0A9P6B3I5_9AGAM|nr:hypothetical protein BS47DRAFT_592868 [Hydnum rufescens UP504]
MRRKNGSKKIPNVILRPVPAPSRDQKRQVDALSDFDPEFDGGEYENEVEIDIQSGTQPFRGVNICCTGIPNKAELFKAIKELGGQHSNDLTDLITHLIAQEPGSAKYNFAVKANIPIMSPNWVLDSHARYINGEDLSLDETERGHRLPCFLNLRICVSGENKLERRHQMARLMHEQGGTYAKDLDYSVTHLLICGDAHDQQDLKNEDGGLNPKIAWALEENEARQRSRTIRQQVQAGKKRRRVIEDEDDLKPDIMIVWSEWFWDCLAAHGRDEEGPYTIDHARPALKALASTPPPPSFASAISSTQQFPGATRNRGARNDDSPETELAILRASKGRMRSSEELWKKLVQQRKPGLASSRPPTDVLKPTNSSARINSLRVFSQQTLEEPPSVGGSRPGPVPVGATVLMDGRLHPFTRVVSTDKPLAAVREVTETLHSGLFSGVIFAALGEASANEAMKAEIRSRDGIFLDINEDNPQIALQKADIVIVRLESQVQRYHAQIRTECWFEQCIFEEKILSVEDHVAFQPIGVPLPIKGLDQVCIAASGLNNQEILFLKRFARAIGLRMPEFFKRKTTTHLVCPSRSGLKYEKALEWGVQVVDLAWVYRIGVTGRVELIDISGSALAQEPTETHPVGIMSQSTFGKPIFDQLAPASLSNISTTFSPSHAIPKISLGSDAKQTLLRGTIPSSQSPSPLKSPVGNAGQQLAAMLDSPDIGSVVEQAHQTTGLGILGPGPVRKKARPIPRYRVCHSRQDYQIRI